MTFFSILIALCLVVLVITWVAAIVDMTKRKDLKGWQIAMWIVIIVLLPIAGLAAYFLFRPPSTDVHYKDEVIQ